MLIRFGRSKIANLQGAPTLGRYRFSSTGHVVQVWNKLSRTQLKQLSGIGGGILIFTSSVSYCRGTSHFQVFCEEVLSSPAKFDASPAMAYGLRKDGSFGSLTSAEAACELAKADKLDEDAVTGVLPVISLEEFKKHTHKGSLWVAYGGVVYDVTSFAAEHPGGADALYGAGGQDIEVMWNHYHVHFKPEVMSTLKSYAIGTLSDESMEALRDPANKESAAAARPLFQTADSISAQRSLTRLRWRIGALWIVTLSASFWWCLRSLVRLIGGVVPVVGAPLAETISTLLPCSVPGYAGAAPIPAVHPKTGRKSKVAVIGGGISGCSCAFSLAESGYDVTVYESRKQLGGNAQTATFRVGKKGEEKMVSQDLSVVYWAPELYRNYTALLKRLGIVPESVELPYIIHTNVNGVSEFYTQPGSSTGLDKILQPSLEDRYAADFRKYDHMIDVIGKVNRVFGWGSKRQSFYSKNQVTILPFLNPLNYVGLKTTALLFGCSREFYDKIVVPFHGLSLTTVHIDNVPGAGYEIIDKIAPLHKTRSVCTWGLSNSPEVFKRTTEKCSVKLETRVRQIHCRKQDDWQQMVIDDHGCVDFFDRVVLACPASAAANIVRPASWMERALLRGVEYHDEFHSSDWKDWLESPVHQDPSCLPQVHHSTIMKHAPFLIDVDAQGREGGGTNVEFTHNLGAFSPPARAHGVAAEDSPMFMTQSLHNSRNIDAEKVVQTFSAPRGHPNLSTNNMVVTQMLHLVQGRRGVYYCSNWTAPGNGHDLACTSGLAAASAVGAAYPLACDEAKIDHRDCRRFMWI